MFYPKVKILDPNWTIPAVYAQEDHYVPFPTSRPFQYCPDRAASAKCATTNTLRGVMLNIPSPNPPADFEAHHILPLSWCGQNKKENGVFLAQRFSDPAGEYKSNTHGQFTYWWLIGPFKPDVPVPNC